MGYIEPTEAERAAQERQLREIAEAVNAAMDPARQRKLIRLAGTWADPVEKRADQ